MSFFFTEKIAFTAFIALLSTNLFAANPIAIACGVTDPCKLDGDLKKRIWEKAPVYGDFLEKYPHNGVLPKFKTTFQVAYDADAVFFAIRAFDPHPDDIRSVFSRHDTLNSDQDYVTILIDPIGNKKFAQFFRVSAAGSTADGIFTSDSNTFNLAPDFIWDAVVQPTVEGFNAEIRIPFSSLRYSSDTDSSWRVMVGRITPRIQRHVSLSVPMPNDAPNFISTIQPLDGLQRPESPEFMQFKPSMTMRKTTDNNNDRRSSESKMELGLDIKLRPSANIVLDATINPDFSQVEIDEPQLNRNVQFALSVQERRPFFLESNDLLDAPTRIVYTRAISNPQWGIRSTLRNDEIAGTLFTVRDDGGGSILLPSAFRTGSARQPRSQATVARGFWNSSDLSVNALLSRRDYSDRGMNTVAGVGAAWQFSEAQRIRLQWLHSSTNALPAASGEIKAGNFVKGNDVFLDYLLRTDSNETTIAIVQTDENFRNDNGFYSQSGYRAISSTYAHTWRRLNWLNEIQAYISGSGAEAVKDDETINYDVAPGVFFSGRNGLEVKIEPHVVSGNRVASKKDIIKPRYWRIELAYSPAAWMPKVTAKVDTGELVDYNVGDVKEGRKISLTANMRLGRHIELSPLIQSTSLRSGSKNAFRENLWRILGIYHFNDRNALRIIAQSHSGRHVAEPKYSLERFQDDTEANSITYIRRPSSNAMMYVGYTERLSTGIANERKAKEFFAKVQMGF